MIVFYKSNRLVLNVDVTSSLANSRFLYIGMQNQDELPTNTLDF